MDYQQMTAPCGLDCFNCHFYLADGHEESMNILKTFNRTMGIPMEVMKCKGCRNHEGIIPLHQVTVGKEGPVSCLAYKCSREKGVDFCHECRDFPCDNLHPYSDRADKVPHNTKVFNLCLIKKMGLEEWAKSKAGQVRETYFNKWWSIW